MGFISLGFLLISLQHRLKNHVFSIIVFCIFFHELFSGQFVIYLFHFTVMKKKSYQHFFSAYELVKSSFTVVIYCLLSYGLTIFFSFGKTAQHRCSSNFNSPASSHQNRAQRYNVPVLLLEYLRYPLPVVLSN